MGEALARDGAAPAPGADVDMTAADPAAIRRAIETVGYAVVPGLVSPSAISEMRAFWLAEFGRPRALTPIVWGPYLGEPNGVIFDRRQSHCLYRSFDYLWNPPFHPRTRSTGLALNRLRNAIVGNEERCGELLQADRYGIYVTTSYYPPGDGWLWQHRDEMSDREHWHYLVPLTFRGTHFSAGGLFLNDRAGRRVDVEPLFSPGSVIFYDGTLPHGVERIVSTQEPPVGRLQMFAIPVVFERPQGADRLIQSIPLARFARVKLSALKRRLRGGGSS